MNRLSSAILAALLLSVSCAKESETPPPAEEKSLVTFSVSDGAGQTKGELVSVSPDIARTVHIAVYDDNGRLEAQAFRKDASVSVSMELNSGCAHKVLAYGNLGDRTDIQPTDLDEALKEIHKFSWQDMETGGCPMSAKTDLPAGASSAAISLVKLLARVTLELHHDFPEEMGISPYSVSVGNTNSSLSLFGASRASGAEDLTEGDYTFTGDSPLVLYVPENLQGTLLPDNDDPYLKNRESLLAAGKNPDVCSYIEVLCDQEDTYGVAGERRFRFYLGKDNVRNFDVERNRDYSVKLSLTQDGINIEDNWKVDNSGLTDSRSLMFAKDSYKIEPGKTSVVDVQYLHGSVIDDSYSFYLAKNGWSFLDLDPRLQLVMELPLKPRIKVVAEKAQFGDVIPVHISTFDRMHKDESTVTVSISNIITTWAGRFRPEYIAQKGVVTGTVPEGISSLSFKAAEGSRGIIRVADRGDGKSATVSAIGEGRAEIIVSGVRADGEVFEICTKSMTVKAPVLTSGKNTLRLDVTGRKVSSGISYRDIYGTMEMKPSATAGAAYFDESLYNELLEPVFEIPDEETAAMFIKNSGTDLYVGRVKYGGHNVIDYYGSANAGSITVRAKGTETGKNIRTQLSAVIDNPFPTGSDNRQLGVLNTHIYNGMGSAGNNPTTLNYKDQTLPGTSGLCTASSLPTLSCDADGFVLSYTSAGIGIRRNRDAAGIPGYGRIAIKGSVKNIPAGQWTEPQTIGYVENYLVCGFGAKATSAGGEYNVSAVFPENEADGKIAAIARALSSSKIFFFVPTRDMEPYDEWYSYGAAYTENGEEVTPTQGDYHTYGSWCIPEATASGRVEAGKTIYKLHIGLSDCISWEGDDNKVYQIRHPHISADITKAQSVLSGVTYSLINGHRLYYLTSDTQKGSSGLPYVLLGFYNGEYTYTAPVILQWIE